MYMCVCDCAECEDCDVLVIKINMFLPHIANRSSELEVIPMSSELHDGHKRLPVAQGYAQGPRELN